MLPTQSLDIRFAKFGKAIELNMIETVAGQQGTGSFHRCKLNMVGL